MHQTFIRSAGTRASRTVSLWLSRPRLGLSDRHLATRMGARGGPSFTSGCRIATRHFAPELIRKPEMPPSTAIAKPVIDAASGLAR